MIQRYLPVLLVPVVTDSKAVLCIKMLREHVHIFGEQWTEHICLQLIKLNMSVIHSCNSYWHLIYSSRHADTMLTQHVRQRSDRYYCRIFWEDFLNYEGELVYFNLSKLNYELAVWTCTTLLQRQHSPSRCNFHKDFKRNFPQLFIPKHDLKNIIVE